MPAFLSAPPLFIAALQYYLTLPWCQYSEADRAVLYRNVLFSICRAAPGARYQRPSWIEESNELHMFRWGPAYTHSKWGLPAVILPRAAGCALISQAESSVFTCTGHCLQNTACFQNYTVVLPAHRPAPLRCLTNTKQMESKSGQRLLGLEVNIPLIHLLDFLKKS